MSIAPDHILRAACDTVSWATIFCRNATLHDSVSVKMINEVMEAIHEVPRMVLDWGEHDLNEIRNHLGCFDASRWPDAPDLVQYFDNRLEEFQGE